MKTRLLVAALLTAAALPAIAHDPAAHRRAAAAPAECAQFQGKDPATIDLKDPAIKAAHDKCEAAKKEAKKKSDEAMKAEHEH